MTDAMGKSLVLPPILDLNAAPQLKQDLLEARAAGEAISVDASNVQRMSSLCLQLLLAAKDDPACQAPMSIVSCSDAFKEMAAGLGLTHALAISGETHG